MRFAARFPRLFNGRSWSESFGLDQLDLPWRRTSRVFMALILQLYLELCGEKYRPIVVPRRPFEQRLHVRLALKDRSPLVKTVIGLSKSISSGESSSL